MIRLFKQFKIVLRASHFTFTRTIQYVREEEPEMRDAEIPYSAHADLNHTQPAHVSK